jgi:hypothetical protein
MVTRQLAMWPFAARVAQLFLLVDPSLADQALRNGLLRAMQQGYFGSDGYSQTRAVREAALAAHYVLRHRNRDVLPVDQINAASAVAAVRGDVAFVALAGQTAAFAWHAGELTGRRGFLRLPRPLGLEQDPVITFWRTPLRAGDRLALVCGATWRPDSQPAVEKILSEAPSTTAAEEQLAEVLGETRPAGILVVAPASPSTRTPHLRLLGGRDQTDSLAQPADPTPAPRTVRQRVSPARWFVPLLGLVLLALMALAIVAIIPQSGAPTVHVEAVSPQMAIRLGPSATDVADLAVGDTALYTLDVAEGAVRAFSLDQLEQRATPETLLARAGTALDSIGGQVTLPVAIEYLPGPANAPGSLAIVDQSRALIQVGKDRTLSAHAMATSADWQQLGALGSGAMGELLFLDSGAQQILAYPALDHTVVDAPRLLLDATSAPRLPFDRVAQILSAGESLVVRLDDGSVHRLGAGGAEQSLAVASGDGARPLLTSAIAPDRRGGLFLADAGNARIVQTDLQGTVLRELRAPELAAVRAMDVSLDGSRLYALIDSGVVVVDIPAE